MFRCGSVSHVPATQRTSALSSAEADHRLHLRSAKSCHLGREVAPYVWIGRQVAARTLIDPAIARHGGRIVKSMGNGLLVEFASPVEAVRCTAELLLAMVTRKSVVPRDRRIRFRSASIWATWWSRTGMYSATASTSPPACKPWLTLAASALRALFVTRTKSTSPMA